MTRPAEGLYAARCRGRDLRALARRGRVRARRRGLDRRPGPAAVHDHPAAAEHHRLAPPRATPSGPTVEDLMIRHARMRGHRDAVPARASTTPPSPPSSCSTASSPRKGRAAQSLGRERYLERMRAFVDDDPRPVMLGQQRRVGGSFDWGRLRYTMDEGSAKAVRVAFDAPLPRRTSPTGPRRSSTGARAAGRASATSRSSPRPRPARSGRCATT